MCVKFELMRGKKWKFVLKYSTFSSRWWRRWWREQTLSTVYQRLVGRIEKEKRIETEKQMAHKTTTTRSRSLCWRRKGKSITSRQRDRDREGGKTKIKAKQQQQRMSVIVRWSSKSAIFFYTSKNPIYTIWISHTRPQSESHMFDWMPCVCALRCRAVVVSLFVLPLKGQSDIRCWRKKYNRKNAISLCRQCAGAVCYSNAECPFHQFESF